MGARVCRRCSGVAWLCVALRWLTPYEGLRSGKVNLLNDNSRRQGQGRPEKPDNLRPPPQQRRVILSEPKRAEGPLPKVGVL